MPKLSFDGTSLLLDTQRLWPVAARLDYAAFPPESWSPRLGQLRDAGFNTVETAAWWTAHQPTADTFNFEGRRDLRRFVETAAGMGLWVVLRAGPHAEGLHAGGLPAWLDGLKLDRRAKPMRRREGNALFLAAAANFYQALFKQLAGLQAADRPAAGATVYAPAGPGVVAACGFAGQGAGPVLAVQIEDHWTAAHPDGEAAYLEPLVRYLRQAGVQVPVLLENQLWNHLPGTVHTWNVGDGLSADPASDPAADLRQLRAVEPDAPAIARVTASADADSLARQLGGVLAAGAGFAVDRFARGTALDSPAPETGGGHALTGPGGEPEPALAAARSAALFSSHFGSVLAHLRPASGPVVAAATGTTHPLSITHLRGERGDLVVLRQAKTDKARTADLLLDEGVRLRVPLARCGATRLLLNARLGGRAMLDYTSLSPLMLAGGHVLAVVGPAGSEGQLSLDGEHLDVTVPRGQAPVVESLDTVTLVVLNEDQAAVTHAYADGLVVGAAGLNAAGEPVPVRGFATQTRVSATGEVSRVKSVLPRRGNAPSLTAWSHADAAASLAAPGDTATLPGRSLHRAAFAPGRAALTLRLGGAAAALEIDPECGPVAIDGPKNRKLTGDIALLTTDGAGPRHGPGRWFRVDAAKLPSPERHPQPAPDAFEAVQFAPGHRAGATAAGEALIYRLKPSRRRPVIIDLSKLSVACVIRINGKPVALHDPAPGPSKAPDPRHLLDPTDDGPFTGGTNAVELALFAPLPKGTSTRGLLVATDVKSEITPEAPWTTEPLPVPGDDAFGDPPAKTSKANKSSKKVRNPAWWRTAFTAHAGSGGDASGLVLTFTAADGGAVVLNGHHAGPFAVGKNVLELHAGWLAADGKNTLTFFDEGGGVPKSVKLARA